ncbi:MAG: type II/IV secretion system protein [Candidatus Vogelbacteria bacterium]|nr:type II/IV secretion system protein [Candidatus Vogelbacteria bacterium]
MDDKVEIPIREVPPDHQIPAEVLNYISRNSVTHYQFVPLGLKDEVLEVGMLDPGNLEARDALQFIASKLGFPYKIFRISQASFDNILKSYEGLTSQVSKALSDLDIEIERAKEDERTTVVKPVVEAEAKIIEEAPVTKIVAVILQHATSGSASDIHIEPTGDRVKVRFRVDGALYASLFLPNSVHDAVVARIKILTNMKLDERRKPQDGRFSARIENRKIDFRVSTMPTYFGEKVVIRILDPERTLLTLPSLGLSADNLEILNEAIKRPYGLILLTGPTGSGKTTTLYSMLREIDKEKNNAVSLEDPIEYNIPGMSQSQVQPEINYTFATGLRSILRQDPDIIMVGEIRDSETAKLAVQASLTGHLVFATLHTNNTAGVVPRLIDMGVDAYLIPATLVLAIAQRLVPTLCQESKESVPVEGSVKAMIDKELEGISPRVRSKIKVPPAVYRARRSATCPGGTKGRVAVFEVMVMNKDLEETILTNPVESEITKVARANGLLTMREDCLLKAFDGLVPFEEVSKL